MKLIASDLDGTLLNEIGQVSENNAAAIKKAVDQGIRFVVATGRSWDSASKPLQAAGITSPVISLNGATIYDEDGELLHEVKMNRDVAKEVLSVCREAEMYLEFFTNKGIYSASREYFVEVLVDIMKSANPNLTEEEIRANAHLRFQNEPVEFIDDYDLIFEMDDVVIYKILGFSLKPEKLAGVRASLGKEKELVITSSGDINLEFNHPQAQKGVALKNLADRLNIPMEDIVAVGDNWNDVSMLQAAGKGIAMGNASDEIKQLADGVTKSNIEDGVAALIESILIEKN
ncbi:Cof-type HAD-IIB family hydrolase [Oceanobacillus luteolus]|uniref:Cof-type HAD-IIB family hydrolase n=1 Tax=Oceanobacillus luteolus TaxID=1274358 RepID=UPI00203B5854|nr:Cof-type HAD-IIB family hydrolase [Oceanobacillus luteolus]MCM3740753.1 Cof-type HAD-IIB family hydrolase [Oceanobacillus luteolus]